MSMTYNVNALPDLIKIGTETENGVEQIAFDASEWLLTWTDMHLSVWAQEPKTDVMYEAQTHRDGAMIVWDVGAQDTRVSGYGAVLVMGETEGGERKLSARVRTYIRESGMQATADAPLAQQPWYTARWRRPGRPMRTRAGRRTLRRALKRRRKRFMRLRRAPRVWRAAYW